MDEIIELLEVLEIHNCFYDYKCCFSVHFIESLLAILKKFFSKYFLKNVFLQNLFANNVFLFVIIFIFWLFAKSEFKLFNPKYYSIKSNYIIQI